ncbi:hypothetical protein [Pseudoalteromonas arctica]|uniref:hypothetical protein n=1 Tax=Pseudoalteromonas arctica TaxID=394751 RepID=UPI0032B73816
MSQPYEEVTVQQIEQDIMSVTGNPIDAKAKALSIYYRNIVIDSVRFRQGLITEDDLKYSRSIQWEHMKAHSKKNLLKICKVLGEVSAQVVLLLIISFHGMTNGRVKQDYDWQLSVLTSITK